MSNHIPCNRFQNGARAAVQPGRRGGRVTPRSTLHHRLPARLPAVPGHFAAQTLQELRRRHPQPEYTRRRHLGLQLPQNRFVQFVFCMTAYLWLDSPTLHEQAISWFAASNCLFLTRVLKKNKFPYSIQFRILTRNPGSIGLFTAKK